MMGYWRVWETHGYGRGRFRHYLDILAGSLPKPTINIHASLTTTSRLTMGMSGSNDR